MVADFCSGVVIFELRPSLCRTENDPAPITWAILTGIYLVFTILLFTNDFHNLAYHNPRLIQGRPFDSLLYEFTPLLWFLMLYSYSLFIVAFVILLKNSARLQRLYRGQSIVVTIV